MTSFEPMPVPHIQPVVFEAREGASEAPAVRIFLGTQPEQYRAERVFFHSLEKVRHPDRRYEVYRMTGLPGFDTQGWRTGFTNYRFAIPDLAGRHGRAIYNDVDQIFLADPAELFDAPLGRHGYLALSPDDSAVMLIDCARMAGCWNFESARRQSKKKLHALAAAEPERWGPLDPAWHARDLEYRHGESKLLHYTTLHLQPWRPTPDQYSYQINPYAEYFLSLEQEADAQGYEVYTAARPSPGFAQACLAPPQAAAALPEDLLAFARATGGASLGLAGAWQEPAGSGLATGRWRFEQLRHADLPVQDVVAARGLESLPAEDLPWLVDRLFGLSRKLVYIQAGLAADGSQIGTLNGWRALLRRIARRYPERCWQLDCRDRDGRLQRLRADFPLRADQPKVWVLLGQHGSDNAQLVAIAKALGWPYECKQTHFTPIKHIPHLLQQGRLAKAAPGLNAPWPDLVLSAGWLSSRIAQWIKRRSAGRTRLATIGRPRTALAGFDLILTTPQYCLPLRDNVVDLPAPYMEPRTPDDGQLEAWRQRFADLPRPWIALLVGGDSYPYFLDAATARALGAQASAAARERGGSLLVSTSPRTSGAAADALLQAIDAPHFDYRFGQSQDNPYPAILALADAFIVSGDSASMLTEALMSGRPVAVFPLPLHRRLKARLRHALERRLGIIDRALGTRGTPRQQDKIGRLYDAGIVAGVLKRGRRLEDLHTALDVSPLPHGLDKTPGLTPELLATSRARAIEAVRALVVAERPLP